MERELNRSQKRIEKLWYNFSIRNNLVRYIHTGILFSKSKIHKENLR